MSIGRALAAAVLLLGASACSSAPVDKTGGEVAPRTLTLASNDTEGLLGVPALDHFAQQVSSLSGGRLQVEVRSSWTGGGYDEPRLLEDVAAGRADLGWVGTRALDLAGAPSFRPLHAPFLVGTYGAQAAVLSDRRLVADLLSTLTPVGVAGLAVLADEIRFPIGVSRPLRSPEDFDGIPFASYPSGIQSEAIAALGARPVSGVDENSLLGGGLDGFESSWWTYDEHDYAMVAPYPTANAGLWPRTVVLFAHSGLLAGLPDEERDWLQHAAGEATAWSLAHASDRVAAEVSRVCELGGRVVTATPAALSALRAAVEPLYAAMREDPAQGPLLDRIEALAEASPADPPLEVPDGCAYTPGGRSDRQDPESPLAGPGRMGDFPGGTYRADVTAEWLTGRGDPRNDIRNNAGVYTLTMREGHWTTHQEPELDNQLETDCQGWFDVRDDVVYFTTTTRYSGQTCAPPTWQARWAATEEGVRWSSVDQRGDPLFGPGGPPIMYPEWTRVR